MHNKSVLRFFTLAIVAALFAATGLQIFVSQVLASAPPVVHIIPSSIENTGNVPVTAVLGTPDASLNQVKARTFEATSPVGHASVPLPGGTHAAGELLLVNTTAKSLIIPSVVIIGNSGVKVGFHGPITLPVGLPGYVRVPAFALDPGQRGNIPSDEIGRAHV